MTPTFRGALVNTRAHLTTLLTVAALLSVSTPSMAQQAPVKSSDFTTRLGNLH